jgi:protein subunit release factor A
MKQIQIEIRASEGGNDSKLLVEDLTNIYVRACKNNNYK